MTVSSTINREQYATNGATTAFTIHFPFFNDTDVKAIWVDEDGVSTTLVLDTDFTVTGGSGSGGTLTTTGTLSPLADDGTLTIYRELDFTQETDYVEDDPLPADSLEGDIDRAVMRDQQLMDALDRSLTFPVTVPSGVSGELPIPVADAVLGFASDGLSIEAKTLPSGTAVYSSIANTLAGTSTAEAVTPDGLAAFWEDAGNVSDGATITLGAGGSFNLITSTTAITAFTFDPSKAGRKVVVRFNTARTLTHNATSLILPGAANITTAQGDICEVEDRGSGNVRVNWYTRADGRAVVGSTDGYRALAIAGTVVSTDNRGVIDFTTAGVTLSFTAAATLGAGFRVTVYNSAASGDITLDPNSTEQLDGQATRLLRPGDKVTLVCTGTAWKTVSGRYSYQTSGETVTLGGDLTKAHGLGVRPEDLMLELVCVNAEGNHATGDAIIAWSGLVSNSGSQGINVRWDATNIVINQSGAIYVLDKTGHTFDAITAANWAWRMKAWAQ